MKTKSLFLLLIIIAFVSCMLVNYDIFFTSLFYQENDFYLKDNMFVITIDKYMEYLVCCLFALSLGIVIFNKTRFSKKLPIQLDFIDKYKAYFLSICFLGWCIALPYLFKSIFHRARPYQTDLFGGECHFSEAFVKSSCQVGDSFISGHTSLAMWLVALALVMPQNIRKKYLLCALGIIFLVATGRVLGGYHFLTDVYFAVLLVGGGIYLTWKKMFPSKTIG